MPDPASTELTRQMILTGTAEPAPEFIALRAGPVRLLYSDGDLRQICYGDIELARRIYVAIRDLDWNTLPGQITDLRITDRDGSFAIRFKRRHTVGELDYEWRAEIDGSADGTISYRMRGRALTAYPYAKIGICVHHPIAGYAGQPYRGSTPDGPVAGNLPDAIGPQIHLDDGTDLPLFEPVSDLDITHASGGVARFEFAGDLWEMEDQRNWTDASYKSASTPAKLGYHHEASAGQAFDQAVVIRATGFAAKTRADGAAGPQTVTLREPIGPSASVAARASSPAAGLSFPPVGLRCVSPQTVPSAAGLAVLRAIGPAHLRADVHLADDSAAAEIAAAAHRAGELNCAVELAIFRPARGAEGRDGAGRDGAGHDGVGRDGAGHDDQAALGRLAAGLAGLTRTDLARVLALGDGEESSSAATVSAVRGALAAAGLADVPVITGTNIYFNELNRHRIPPGQADGLAWSVNPQIHAFDNFSLMENLQAQPDTVATARSFAPGTPCYVTPITLRPRFNAVAVTDQEFPEAGLPWQVDVRQPSLFGAAWTLGSVAALAAAGAAGLTFFSTQGPDGVVEHTEGSPAPAEFFSRPDTPYPLAVVLADACGLAGRPVLALDGLDPALLAGIAVEGVVLLANLTSELLEVRVRASGSGRALARLLDETTFAAAAGDFEGFLASRTDLPVSEGAVTVTLRPYATARLDLTGE